MLNLSNCVSANLIARGNCIAFPDQFSAIYISGIAILLILSFIIAKRGF